MNNLNNEKIANYINNSQIKVIDTKERKYFIYYFVHECMKYVKNPFRNLTVADVAKDLHCNQNTANEIFRRKDFPAICVGKSKKVMFISYILWKLERKDGK
jgi:hypothetical protein